ncbi:MAG: hypothetical protein QM648_00840 [Solirubrobacterales bacterium]
MKASPENRLIKGLDLVIDFATLGEYRVVTDAPRRPVAQQDIWARDIDWSQGPRGREIKCSLPRARDRKLARERVRG